MTKEYLEENDYLSLNNIIIKVDLQMNDIFLFWLLISRYKIKTTNNNESTMSTGPIQML